MSEPLGNVLPADAIRRIATKPDYAFISLDVDTV
jgi:hypothetical protein